MPENIHNNKRVAKNTLYLFLRMLLVTAVGIYTSRVVLDALGVSDFGIYNVVGGIVILFSFFQNALNNATSRFLTYVLGEDNIKKQQTTFSMAINVHFLLALIIIFLSETIGLWALNTYLVIPADRLVAANIVYQSSVAGFFLIILRTPYNSSIIAHERMNFYAYTSVIEVLLKLLVVLLLYKVNVDRLSAYASLIFAVDLIIFIWYYLYCRKSYSECNYKKVWDKSLFSQMTKFSSWSLVLNASDVCVAQSIVFFFNVFFGVITNAALGVANQVTNKVNMLLGSFSQAFEPQIIKSYAKKDMGYFMSLLFSTSKISYYLMFFVCVPLLINIDYILDLWLVEVPENTSVFIFYTILYAMVDAYSAPLWIAVYATGNIRTHQLLMTSIKILNVPLAYIMLKYGYDAWTALALKFALNVLCSIIRPVYMRKLINLKLIIYIRKVFLPISLVTIMSLPLPVYLSMYYEGWNKLLITSLSSFILTSFFVAFWGLDAKERSIVRQIVHL